MRDVERFGPKDTFTVARDKPTGRVVAYEIASSPTDVWQGREETLGDGTNKLVPRKLDLPSERVRVKRALVVGGDLRVSLTDAGLTPIDDVLSMLDDALEGHAELSDIRPGARLRLVATQERVDGAFARWASLDVVEYFPAAPNAPPVRVYNAGAVEERSSARSEHREWYDAKGRQPYRGGWRAPVPLARIASPFNPHRMHPVLHVVMPHNGVDFAAPTGAPVYATAAGVVLSAGNAGPCGNMVEIAHPGGITSVYCHLSRFASGLHSGQHVEGRQLIAYVGQTGRVTGPHLHFGIKKNGVFVDPMTLRLDSVRVIPRSKRDEFDRLRAELDAELDSNPAADGAGGGGCPRPPTSRPTRSTKSPEHACRSARSPGTVRGCFSAIGAYLHCSAAGLDAMVCRARWVPRRGGACVRSWLRWAFFASCGAVIGAGCGSSRERHLPAARRRRGERRLQRLRERQWQRVGQRRRRREQQRRRRRDDRQQRLLGRVARHRVPRLVLRARRERFGSGSGSGEAGPACSPSGVTCQGSVANDCSGGTLTTTDCSKLSPPETCANGYGCVVCTPGTGSCSGNTSTVCNSTGTGYTTTNCDPQLGESCNAATGLCTGDCASVGSSYIGCEYYAVTMANAELNQSVFFYSVSISNTTSNQATIVITGPSYNQTFTLAAGAIQNYELPWVDSVSCNGGTCNGNLPINVPVTKTFAASAYHIKSTEPVTVYQFNPYNYTLSGTYSYANDASLLIPVNAMTGNYQVAAWPSWHTPGFNSGGATCSTSSSSYEEPGNVTVVATANGTSVTVATTGAMQAGAGLTASGGTVTLNQGDVLQISSALDAPAQCSYGSDLSGTHVTANQPIEVFGGHDCTFISAGAGYCDHIEEIILPVETLRGDYLVTLPNNKNATPRQYVKIVGTAAGTTLTFDPPVQSTTTIGAGQVLTFEVTQHFHLTATQPVLVAQYMEGQTNFGASCVSGAATDCGNPSESVAVATAQFRESYQFIAPPSYAENWVNIIAPNGATVMVDGTTVAGYSSIGGSGYGVAYFPLCGAGSCGGVHSASSTSPFGIEVYGYGSYTSYMYPGGLNLTRQ